MRRPSPRVGLLAVVAVAAAAGTITFSVRDQAGAGPTSQVSSQASYASDAAMISKSTAKLRVCGVGHLLNGPAHKPHGAHQVTPSHDLPSVVDNARAGTTFYLTRGVFHLGSGAYDQVIPKSGDTFIGAPGAVIDGQHKNLYAFGQQAKNVTISYLTIRNFGKPGDNEDEGVVNHDSGTGWTITHDTLTNNAGAGTMLGNHDTLRSDCLSDNGQYGFNAYSNAGDVSDLKVEHNEISGNDTDNWEARVQDCGCSGGGKFWSTRGATVTYNYVHGNHSVGLWADTNNRGFNISHNVISNQPGEGLIYEISYNALISHNLFVRDAIGEGPQNAGFPSSAVYISESGSDSRVHTRYNKTFLITKNRFVDDWSGVVLWENADRFCNSPDNSSSGTCTLVNRPTVTDKTCTALNISKAPYFNDCRWKTQNVTVSHNSFRFTPSGVSSKCTTSNSCGFNGVFSNYGSDPSWSPYKGSGVEQRITLSQHNQFVDNTYVGPWHFMPHDQGKTLSFKKWRAAPYHQDAGSSITS